MKTIKNFNSLPASIVTIYDSDNPLYTRAKLKVFYIGMTADGRLFTEEFSNKLIKSIGYAPVVSRYNEEKDDFEGHAAQQNIYGIVDPMCEPVFEEDKGVKWATVDVILYTHRPDKTGDIASKIVGHPQSLELNPDTVKYKINRDSKGRFENIEFLDAQFIGVSVLGHDQEPAFTGSAFFENLDSSFADLRGKEMDKHIQEFVKLSWGEKFDLICNALYEKYGDDFGCTIDVYDKWVICYVRNAETGDYEMMKVSYKLDGEAVEIGEAVRVHPSYEEFETEKKKPQAENDDDVIEDLGLEDSRSNTIIVPEGNELETPHNIDGSDEGNEPEPEQPENVEGEHSEEQPEQSGTLVSELPGLGGGTGWTVASVDDGSEPQPEPQPEPEPEEPIPEPDSEPEPEPPVEPDPEGEQPAPPVEPDPNDLPADDITSDDQDEKKKRVNQATVVGADGKEPNDPKENETSPAALSSAELEELQAYRRKDKIALIDSYSDTINEEELNILRQDVDKYTKEELTNKLNSLFVTYARRATPVKKSIKWAPDPVNSGKKDTSDLAEYIRNMR